MKKEVKVKGEGEEDMAEILSIGESPYLSSAILSELDFLDDIVDGSATGYGLEPETLFQAQSTISLIKAGVERLAKVKGGVK